MWIDHEENTLVVAELDFNVSISYQLGHGLWPSAEFIWKAWEAGVEWQNYWMRQYATYNKPDTVEYKERDSV